MVFAFVTIGRVPVRWMTDPTIAIGNATARLAHREIWNQPFLSSSGQDLDWSFLYSNT
jgi:hypothetical protein